MVNQTLFWAATAVYAVVIFYLAWLGYKRTKCNADYMLAGRNIHPVILGLSYGATFISTSAIVGFGGYAARLGLGIIWLVMLNILVGVLIAFIVFGKPTRRIGKKLGALTFPDLLGKVYKSDFMQYVTALIIMVGMPLYSSAVLIGGGRFIEEVLDVPYLWAIIGLTAITAVYVVLGGLVAVMYTDALQGSLMIFGMSAIMIITLSLVGGFDGFQSLTDMSHLVPAGLASTGMTGWTSFPELGSATWYTLVTTIIMGVGIGVLAQPQLAVRFMTAKDGKALNRAIPVGVVFILITTGVAYTMGALTNVYFYEKFGKISTEMTGNVDNIIPLFIDTAMPEWLVVMFVLVLLAAAMSTMSSLFHVMGTAAGHDIWVHLRKAKFFPSKLRGSDEDASKLKVNKVATFIMIAASLGLAFIMPGDIIARATAMFMGLCAAAFLPAYTVAVFSKNPSRLGAIASLLTGSITWAVWTVFVHKAESSVLKVSELLTGSPSVLDFPWTVVDSLFIALPLSIAALIIGTMIERRRGPTAVEA
ncbi:MAG: sodium/panthothenate symporter [Methanomassiliicoccales archaeon PtaB.Bin215]|nr:MAG: sodium/panthothenate symporter [Methanomassiliicoccales archaeon PtaB.Bin215]